MENLTESTKFDYSRLQKVSVETKGNSLGNFLILNYSCPRQPEIKVLGQKSKNSESYKTLEVQGR